MRIEIEFTELCRFDNGTVMWLIELTKLNGDEIRIIEHYDKYGCCNFYIPEEVLEDGLAGSKEFYTSESSVWDSDEEEVCSIYNACLESKKNNGWI